MPKGLNFNNITMLTDNQHDAKVKFELDQNLVLSGSAGTGKTFLACYFASLDVLDSDTPYDKIVLIRSAVATRDVGFLPGSLEEKMAVYESPYMNIFSDIFTVKNAYNKLKQELKILDFETTSHLRGETFNNSVIIVDEFQNMTFHELYTIITRIGKYSKIYFAGDFYQTDLNGRKESSGFDKFVAILENMEEFEFTEFDHDDIVRSDLVKSFIIEKEIYERDQ